MRQYNIKRSRTRSNRSFLGILMEDLPQDLFTHTERACSQNINHARSDTRKSYEKTSAEYGALPNMENCDEST